MTQGFLWFKISVILVDLFKPQRFGVFMEPKMLAIDAANFLDITVQAIHKRLRTQNLAFDKVQNRIYFGHNTSRKIFNFQLKPKTISIQVVKGGTGKTSISHSLAVRAYLYGLKVLCIALDQQANLTQSFLYNADETPIMTDFINDKSIKFSDCIVSVLPELDLIPSRIENAVLDNSIMLNAFPLDKVYRDNLAPLKSKYDLILFDCPPALGQSVSASALASDLVILPITPEKFSISGLQVSCSELEQIQEKYGHKINTKILINKYDARTNLSQEVLKRFISHPTFGPKMLNTFIRINQEFPNVVAAGSSIFDSTRPSTAKEDVDLLARETLDLNNSLVHQENSNAENLEVERELANL